MHTNTLASKHTRARQDLVESESEQDLFFEEKNEVTPPPSPSQAHLLERGLQVGGRQRCAGVVFAEETVKRVFLARKRITQRPFVYVCYVQKGEKE